MKDCGYMTLKYKDLKPITIELSNITEDNIKKCYFKRIKTGCSFYNARQHHILYDHRSIKLGFMG